MATFKLTTTTTVRNPVEHDLYLDESGQPVLIGADIEDLEGYAEALAQSVKCRILLIRGEWYLDIRVGTPWKERLWRKGMNTELVKRVFKDVIETTPRVRRVVSMDVTMAQASRTATISSLVIETETKAIVTVAVLDQPQLIKVPNV